MRVTAYLGGVASGTNTMTAAAPGTWPTATLAISVPAGFDSVVVHYDAPPPTGGDWGPIFMADNMAVTAMPLVPSSIRLTDPIMLPDGTFQFSFTNTPGVSFTVLGTEDLSQSVTNWTVVGAPIEVAPGQFQFIDTLAPNSSAKFYSVRSP
jgi:hypothetical protein